MSKKFNIVAALLALLILVPAAHAANTDNPDGCKPTGLFGQFSEPFQPFEAAAAQTIAEGDPVKLDGSGQVTIAAVTDSSLLGFARTAVAGSSAGDLIYVYSDPNTVFECQCSGSFAITMVGSSVDLEGTTGIFEVNENATVYKPVRIVGYNAADAVGANARVYVRLNMASLGNSSSGVFDDLAVLDDLTVGDDAAITGLATVGETLGVTGVSTLTAGLTDGVATLDGSGGWSGIANLAMTGNLTGAVQGAFSGSLSALNTTTTEVFLETTGNPTADAGNGAVAHRVIKATYDFAIHGGGTGAINIGLDAAGTAAEAIVIPAGSLIKKTYAYVETAFTSGGAATVAFEIAGANDVITATAFDNALYTVSTAAEGIQDGTPAAMEVLAGTVHVTVGGADLTGGRVHLFIEYMTAL